MNLMKFLNRVTLCIVFLFIIQVLSHAQWYCREIFLKHFAMWDNMFLYRLTLQIFSILLRGKKGEGVWEWEKVWSSFLALAASLIVKVPVFCFCLLKWENPCESAACCWLKMKMICRKASWKRSCRYTKYNSGWFSLLCGNENRRWKFKNFYQ